jgi:DNA-binding response OmpR family regulator
MRPRFLVVDDDADTRNLVEAMLNALVCDATLVESGEEALEALDSEEKVKAFDAVFLDVMMPGLNGFEVLERLKAQELTKELPVIMLTAKDGGDELIAGYRIGADYYIPKPFTKQQIEFGLDLLLADHEDPPRQVQST